MSNPGTVCASSANIKSAGYASHLMPYAMVKSYHVRCTPFNAFKSSSLMTFSLKHQFVDAPGAERRYKGCADSLRPALK